METDAIYAFRRSKPVLPTVADPDCAATKRISVPSMRTAPAQVKNVRPAESCPTRTLSGDDSVVIEVHSSAVPHDAPKACGSGGLAAVDGLFRTGKA
jgi:hypothetical protein